MIEFLVELLSPFFLSLGVSQADIDNYANQLSGYVYVVLGVSVLVAIIMIAAHWFVKKGTRHVVRWSAGLAWVLVVAVIANIISFGPMYNNLAPIINGRGSVSEETVEHSKEVIQKVGEEGMVLLKNDGTLPLASDIKTVNVFGWASVSPVFSGTGSGASDSTGSIGIAESLEMAGFETNDTLINLYKEYADERPGAFENEEGWRMTDWSLPEPPVDYYTDEIMDEAKEFSDTAVVTIARTGGEGRDEPMDMKALIDGTYDPRGEYGNALYDYYDGVYNNNGDYDDFEQGEHYLELSSTEEAMIEMVSSEFENVIVLINANNTLELGWVENEAIDAVILAPGTGATGMAALGEILNGTMNPSGKTVDTYVYDLTSTPTYNNFGSFIFNNTQELVEASLEADPAYQGVQAFVNYTEGIYVGYKFYETAAEEGLINYGEMVQYPFGYGLSYTTFAQEIAKFADNGNSISMDVTVTNTGEVSGKTPVEIYYTPPYTEGGIEKASVNLIEFGKTDILEPGESETLSFEILKEDMASYDSSEIKVPGGGYILEQGEYAISLRSDSHTVIEEEHFIVDEDIIYNEEGRESDILTATNQFEDYSAGDVTYLSRANGFANYSQAIAAPSDEDYAMDEATLASVTEKSVAFYDPTKYNNPEDEMPVMGEDHGVELADLTGKDYDDPLWEDLLDQLSMEDMTELVNLAGFQTVAVKSVGKVATLDSDGTSGLNDWYIQVYGTAYPVEVLIAQTWNKELAYDVGDALATEYADCGIYGWYGPAMNIHRSAFGGRNFEYYSEDSVLSGHIASSEVNAAAERGVYAYIKHFALNEQEGNRCSMLLTYSNEQTIREIYLKPFEISVKNFDFENNKPLAVMSSFVFIGDRWSGANPNLLNTVLREEWGFRGMVLTDWNGSYGYQNTDDCVRNGNDGMLGFMQHESNKLTDTDSATLAKALRQASKNIMYTVANSGNYTVKDTNAGGLDNMTKIFIGVDVGIGLLVILIGAFVIVRYRKKRQAVQIIIEESDKTDKA
ncbi:beta-glucosidase [Murimonas intestini]|uniref:beta-glucosidase n=1 Tax=Murimonas intestini TaxID=1337051 RepID=UPI0011DCE3D9|nr:glycoside hydrolase family 3 C-terminal domain-containing protein [Murimonas intestini]